MRWLVCGGRDFGDITDKVRGTPEWDKAYADHYWGKGQLDRLAEKYSKFYTPYDSWMPHDIEIIHGACKRKGSNQICGADLIADEWAVVNWIAPKEFPVEWERYGLAAGPIRNQKMLDEGKPDLVVALPGGRGTDDMISRAEKAGVPILRLTK